MSRTFLIAIPAALAVSLALATVRSDATAPVAAGVVASQTPGNGVSDPDRATPFDLDGHLAPANSDADRGCCVWKSTPAKCAFTNRGYCRTKAGQSAIAFDFYEDTKCAAVSACPRNSPGSL